MQTLWLYLHFPNLQLDALFTAQNERQQHPLVVLDEKTNQVVQLNQTALEAGISRGMSLGTAASLDRHLQVIPYQEDIEQRKLKEVAEHLYLMTCDICFFEPQGLLLRIHNMLNLYGGLKPYWRALRNQLAPFGLGYHYATGHSPLAAEMLAKGACNKISQHSPDLDTWVAQCTLQQAKLPTKTLQNLQRVGIRTVGDLLTIPLSDIAKRFDIELVTYLGRLTGEFKHPVNFFHPPENFDHYLELLYEIENADVLQHPLKRLLTSLEQFLKLRDALTQQLVITCYQRDDTPLLIEVGSQQGEYRAEQWLTLTRLKLENIQLESPVHGIGLITGTIYQRSPDKSSLFGARQGTVSRLQLISMLQAKLGEQAVASPALNDDFRPEIAVGLTYQAEQSAEISCLFSTRPSFVLQSPQPLSEQVSIIHGPERLHTGWWDGHQVIRDYFIARTPQNGWYWVYRTPENHWYIHGVFS